MRNLQCLTSIHLNICHQSIQSFDIRYLKDGRECAAHYLQFMREKEKTGIHESLDEKVTVELSDLFAENNCLDINICYVKRHRSIPFQGDQLHSRFIDSIELWASSILQKITCGSLVPKAQDKKIL